MGKSKIILLILLLTSFVGAISSFFMPFLLKSESQQGYLSDPALLNGTEYPFFMEFILIFYVGSIVGFLFEKKGYLSSLFSILILVFVYLTRWSIHFQGFIDHDYNSSTGFGYRLLFGCAMFHFLVLVFNLAYNLLNQKSRIDKQLI